MGPLRGAPTKIAIIDAMREHPRHRDTATRTEPSATYPVMDKDSLPAPSA